MDPPAPVGIRHRPQQLSPNFLESVALSPNVLSPSSAAAPAPAPAPAPPTFTSMSPRGAQSILMALLTGLVAGLVVLVGGSTLAGFLVMRRRQRAKERDANTIGSIEGLLDGAIQPKNKRFNSSDIARITDNFSKVIGKGGFGTVYYGILQDGTVVAVKVLNNTSSTISLKQFCAEAELLMRIHHVNLVTLIGYCDEHANMALVYEYMSCGDLHAQLSEKNKNPLTWEARLRISVDAAQGLEYLHSGCRPPIIHRDIKPANILLDEMRHAKIADFGLSRFFNTDSQGAAVWTDLAGTRGYLDPEYYHPINALSEKSDVYAFGVVLLQLLTGQPALIKNTNQDNGNDLNVILIVDWVLPKVESGDILVLIDKRLQGDLILNSAWKFLEIAMECVKRTGNERPIMSEVVADLKACYALEECRERNDDGDSLNYYSNSGHAVDTSIVSLPIAR